MRNDAFGWDLPPGVSESDISGKKIACVDCWEDFDPEEIDDDSGRCERCEALHVD